MLKIAFRRLEDRWFDSAKRYGRFYTIHYRTYRYKRSILTKDYVSTYGEHRLLSSIRHLSHMQCVYYCFVGAW